MLIALASLLPILATARANSLLLTPSAPVGALPDCIAASYHGHYAGQHAYLLSEDCTSTTSLGMLDSGSLIPLASEDRIVWAGSSNALPSSRQDMLSAWETIDSTASSLLSTQGEDAQTSLSSESFQVSLDRVPTLVHASESGLYLSVPSSILPVLDTLLPAQLTPVAFPLSPLAVPTTSGNRWGVPEAKAAHLVSITEHLQFNPKLAAIASSISAKDILEDVQYLTGEREDSDIESRHSFHPDILKAHVWVRRECAPQIHAYRRANERAGHQLFSV